MRYLVTFNWEGRFEVFYTQWFDPENNFNKDAGMIVYDLAIGAYTKDGIEWIEIEEDHL
jgi:hypothetical protein